MEPHLGQDLKEDGIIRFQKLNYSPRQVIAKETILRTCKGETMTGGRPFGAIGMLRSAVAVACALLAIANIAACGDDEVLRYGNLSSSADLSAFNLDDVQPDWWPKDDSFGQGSGTNPELNRSESNDNVVGGNERRFFAVRKYSEKNRDELFTRKIDLEPDGTYQGYIYFRNSAPGDKSGAPASEGTSVSLSLPETAYGRKQVDARLFSKNAVPSVVSSSIVLATPPGVGLSLKLTSAEVRMRAGDVEYPVSTDEILAQRGTPIGCDRPDGHLAAKNECWGQVLFTFKALKNSFTLEGLTAPVERDDFSSYTTIARNSGDFRIALKYRNTGSVDQYNLDLGGVSADDPAAYKILTSSYRLRRGGGEWLSVDMDERGFYRLERVRSGEVVYLSVQIVISDWTLFCNRGAEYAYMSAWPDYFSKSRESIAIYPEAGAC